MVLHSRGSDERPGASKRPSQRPTSWTGRRQGNASSPPPQRSPHSRRPRSSLVAAVANAWSVTQAETSSAQQTDGTTASSASRNCPLRKRPRGARASSVSSRPRCSRGKSDRPHKPRLSEIPRNLSRSGATRRRLRCGHRSSAGKRSSGAAPRKSSLARGRRHGSPRCTPTEGRILPACAPLHKRPGSRSRWGTGSSSHDASLSVEWRPAARLCAPAQCARTLAHAWPLSLKLPPLPPAKPPKRQHPRVSRGIVDSSGWTRTTDLTIMSRAL